MWKSFANVMYLYTVNSHVLTSLAAGRTCRIMLTWKQNIMVSRTSNTVDTPNFPIDCNRLHPIKMIGVSPKFGANSYDVICFHQGASPNLLIQSRTFCAQIMFVDFNDQLCGW